MNEPLACPGCGKTFTFNRALVGKRVRCPRCQEAFTVRAPKEDAASTSLQAFAAGPALTNAALKTPANPKDRLRQPRGLGSRLLLLAAGAGMLTLAVLAFTGFYIQSANGRARGPAEVVQGGPTTPWENAAISAKPSAPITDSRSALRPPVAAPPVPVAPPPPMPVPNPPKPPEPEPEPASALALTDKDKTTVTLPGVLGDVVVGGSGRYLLLHMAMRRTLAVFDVAAGKIVGSLSVPDEQARVAAGASKLLVALPSLGLLQRWDLETLRREVTVPLPFPGRVRSLTLGDASEGPALVHWIESTEGSDKARFTFLDIEKLNPLEVPRVSAAQDNFLLWPDFKRDLIHIRPSADGRVFGIWSASGDPRGLGVLIVNGRECRSYYEHRTVGHIVPDPSGKVLYTGAGALSPQRPERPAPPARIPDSILLPARQGDFYLRFPSPKVMLRPGQPDPPIEVYRAGEDQRLLRLTNVEGSPGTNWWDWVLPDFPNDKRIHFFPLRQLLVTIPATQDRLVLHRLDLEGALTKANLDFLLVTSQPPAVASKGTTWSYEPAAKSRKGGVKFRLEAGPRGMIFAVGKLTWDVPADHPDGPSTSVVLRASDDSGQETAQTFRVGVRSARPPVEKESAFEAPPAEEASRSGLKPPALEADRVERPLPAPIIDVAVGGGGRYLVLHLSSQKKLAVFDANAGKVVQEIPAEADKVCFAASKDKLLVVRDSKTVERWSLTTFRKEDSTELPFRSDIDAAAMGSASNGPLVLGGVGLLRDRRFVVLAENLPLRFLDIETLREVTFQPEKAPGIPSGLGVGPKDLVRMQISADGRVLGMWGDLRLSPSGLQTVSLDGQKVRASYEHVRAGHVFPGPDGKVVYTAAGLHTVEGKVLVGELRRFGRYCLPAQQGPYYLAAEVIDYGPPPFPRRPRPFSLCLLGDARPVCPLPEVEVEEQEVYKSTALPLYKRVHLLPESRLLVFIPAAGDRLVLHRFDPDAQLANSDLDYLFLTSQAPTSAQRGKTYTYQLRLKCKAKTVRYRVELGPPGLEVARGGKVTWAVPPKFEDAKVPVVLCVQSDSGQECFQNFTIDLHK